MLDDAQIAGLVGGGEDVADPCQPPRAKHLHAQRFTTCMRKLYAFSVTGFVLGRLEPARARERERLCVREGDRERETDRDRDKERKRERKKMFAARTSTAGTGAQQKSQSLCERKRVQGWASP